jgi:uncharacterized protein YutD
VSSKIPDKCCLNVGAHGNPDLRLHGFLAGAKKRLDAQMLLDTFEEQH